MFTRMLEGLFHSVISFQETFVAVPFPKCRVSHIKKQKSKEKAKRHAPSVNVATVAPSAGFKQL